PDHLPGQVKDANRFAHIEYEDLPALTHGARLQHELASFGYGHEVACDFGVCYCYRTSLFDLLLEHGDYRPIRAQHVTKTRRNKTRLELSRFRQHVVERLDIDLRNALGATHNVGGVDSLVR